MVPIIPLATPRVSAGTDPIVELVLAGANSANPKPNPFYTGILASFLNSSKRLLFWSTTKSLNNLRRFE
jgi:hypothetical protein